MRRLVKTFAGRLADSPLFGTGRKLFQLNTANWLLPLSKFEKLQAGLYIILKDYSEGRFPPRFANEQTTHQAERDYYEVMPGISLAENREAHMRKPFWGPAACAKFNEAFVKILNILLQRGINAKSRILELGCGSGWMGEFFAISGYSVVGTSIAPHEIELANQRAESFRYKGLKNELLFRVSPMESVDKTVADLEPFDVILVFEALHHAYDWRRAIRAAYGCLKPGGWLLLANEPNILHTFISYRVAKIANNHEIGLSQKELIAELKACPFSKIDVIEPRLNNLRSEHWIAARK